MDDNVVIEEPTITQNNCYCCSDNNNNHSCKVYQELLQIKQMLSEIYNNSMFSYSEDFHICNEIIKKEGYFDLTQIRKNPKLKDKYEKQRYRRTDLYNELLKNNPELNKVNRGRDVLICRKGNESAMIKKAQAIQSNNEIKQVSGSVSKAVRVGIYLRDKHLGESLSSSDLRKIIIDVGGKTKNIHTFVKELKNSGYIKPSAGGYGPFFVIDGGGD